MQLTIREASKLLKTPERQIYRWIDDGEIPFSRVNDQIRFNQAELLEWATSRRMPIAEGIFRDAEGNGGPPPRLDNALALGGVHHGVKGADRDAVVRAVVEQMPVGPEVDREFLVQVLVAREVAGSTAVGEGIAIPHVRSPVVLNGAPASITLCTLAAPVDFGAPDGQPIHTVFAIVSPTIPAHLQLLAKLAAALHDADFKAAVLRRAPYDEILKHARRLDEASGPR
jgi:PTS system nitrogen regulatory IIA component